MNSILGHPGRPSAGPAELTEMREISILCHLGRPSCSIVSLLSAAPVFVCLLSFVLLLTGPFEIPGVILRHV